MTMDLNKTQQGSFVTRSQKPLYNSFNLAVKTTAFALLFVLLMSPQHANAGIFSKIGDLFSSDAKAETVESDTNSQNAPILEAKLGTDPKSKTNNDPVNISEENDVLVPEVGALGSAADVEDYPEEDEISVYVTKKGDTLAKIAKMYNVSVNTIIWANDGIDNKKELKEGTSLLIMPINGVSHTVKKGENLAKIAKKYSADADEIATFNGVTDETLVVGSTIIVPNGELAVPKKTVAPKKTSLLNNLKVFAGNGKGTSRYIPGYDGASQNGYYRRPVYCITTQGLHGKNGIDLGCPIGTAVAAAANGTVIAARTGWNGGYGNMIIISHPNGTQTLYGHLSRINVSSGESVSDGQIIGATGNSGKSTGPHLHFEVRGARNCYADGSCR